MTLAYTSYRIGVYVYISIDSLKNADTSYY